MPGSGGGDMRSRVALNLCVTLDSVPQATLGCPIKEAQDGRD